MDKYLIKKTGKSSEDNVPPDKANKRKSQSEKDAEYKGKRQRTFQSKWLGDFQWLRQDDDGISYCHVCRKHPDIADQKSGMFIGKIVDRRDTLSSHQSSAKHAACLMKDSNKSKQVTGLMDKAIAKVHDHELNRYEKLFNTAYAVAKNNRPFSDYTFLCEIQMKNGLHLGSDHLGRDACVNFIKTISEVIRNDIKNHMNRVRFISIMSDGSTDSSVTDQEAVLLRYVHPDTYEPATVFASIEKLENAAAEGVLKAIIKGVSECGVNLREQEGPKVVCVNMDGAAVNMGAKNGVAKKINDIVENQVIVTHCVAHKLELGILDAVKEVGYLQKFEDGLKRICKFYSFSPKWRSQLHNLSVIFDEDILMPSEIKAVRWVSSKNRALRAVCQDLHVISSHMEEVISNSNRADEIGQAKAILSEISQVKFVKYIYLMMDVLAVVSATSKLFQVKDLMIFEIKCAIDTLFTKLHVLAHEPGEYLGEFYKKYDIDSKMFEGKIKLKGTIVDFKDDKDISVFLEKVSQYIVKRFSCCDQSPLSHFQVFDFRTWPNKLSDLSTFGNSDIKSLCQLFSDILSETEVKEIPAEWQSLKVQISLQKHDNPLPVYIDVMKRVHDYTHKNIRTLVAIMLTVSPSTAACERVFSNMNIVKNPQRSKLTQDNLQNQMRIIANGVSVSEFDPKPCVSHWLKTGNRHLMHKQPVKSTVAAAEPSTSDLKERESITPLLQDLVKHLGGEEAARAKLKEMTSTGQDQCIIM